jgi:serine/threonine protein kinase
MGKITNNTKGNKSKNFHHPFKKQRLLSPLHLKGFTILKSIAKGSFGRVYKGRKDGIDCAIKFVDLKDHEGDFPMEGIVTEWLSSHKIGPKFRGCWSIPKEGLGVLVSDLWDGCLDDFMDKNDRKIVPKMVMDKVTSQVKKLHDLGHAHLDLHGGNVLVKWDSTGKKIVDTTITDFGKTQHIEGLSQERIDLPVDLFELKKTKCPKNIDRQFIAQLRVDYK